MKHLISAAAFILSAIPVAAHAQSTANIDCKDPKSQVEYSFCAEKDFEKADAELNVVYKQVKANILEGEKYGKPDQIKNLISAEEKWIAVRDADCGLEYETWDGGTGGGAAELQCSTEETLMRIQFLKHQFLR